MLLSLAIRDVVLIDRLELPNLYRRSPDRLHTSSDGQKFEVHLDSLNANYSFKYFGKGQGVSPGSTADIQHRPGRHDKRHVEAVRSPAFPGGQGVEQLREAWIEKQGVVHRLSMPP